MPSTFPGIDPYLESQGYWPDFHAQFTTYCCDALNDQLPETYEARLGEQVRLIELGQSVQRTTIPDVVVVEGGAERRGNIEASGSVLTLEPVTIDLPAQETEEIRDV
jgi:hypothetical protein